MNIRKLSQRPKVFGHFFGISPKQFNDLIKELELLWQEAEHKRKSALPKKKGGG